MMSSKLLCQKLRTCTNCGFCSSLRLDQLLCQVENPLNVIVIDVADH